MTAAQLPDLLGRHPFTRGLSAAQVEKLIPCARLQSFQEGAAILREGGEADALYLILGGRVALEQHVPGKGAVQLEQLSGGDILGLSWLFPGGRWTLDGRALDATEVVVLDARGLQAQMNGDAALGLALSRYVIHQLYHRLERVRLQRLDVYRGAA